MTIQEALKPYREPRWGLLGDKVNPTDPSGNAMLYEAHAKQIAMDRSEPYADRVSAVDNLTQRRGLLDKKPGASDFQTHDDYIGYVSIGDLFAEAVVERGRAHGWTFNNQRPDETFWKALKRFNLEAWHGRFVGLVPHYLISAGISPNLLGWIGWLASIYVTTRVGGNESGWLLDYLKIRAAQRQFPNHWATRMAIRRLRGQLDIYYGGNISGVYARYFGATHPFALYSDWTGR